MFLAMRTSSSFFIRLLEGLPPPPCMGCEHAVMCAEQQLACSEFTRYCTAWNRVPRYRDIRIPTRAIYDRLFPGNTGDDDE